MKKILTISSVLIATSILAYAVYVIISPLTCDTILSFLPCKKQASQLTREGVENAQYGQFKLTNGKYEYTFEQGKADAVKPTRGIIEISDNKIVFGDIDGDGKDDAAVILVENTSGSGWFYSLAVLINKDGKPSYMDQIDLGDRVIINSVSVKEKEIVIDMVTHGPKDGLCCPTLRQTVNYTLFENKLQIRPELKTYRDEYNGYEVKYPASWMVKELNEGQILERFVDKNGESIVVSGPYLSSSVTYTNRTKMSFEDIIKSKVLDSGPGIQSVSLVRKEYLGGNENYVYSEWDIHPENMRQIRADFLQKEEGDWYDVVLFELLDPKYKEDFYKMVSTLKFFK